MPHFLYTIEFLTTIKPLPQDLREAKMIGEKYLPNVSLELYIAAVFSESGLSPQMITTHELNS
jgi:hypothetical protein